MMSHLGQSTAQSLILYTLAHSVANLALQKRDFGGGGGGFLELQCLQALLDTLTSE